jgi:hypothetical protein
MSGNRHLVRPYDATTPGRAAIWGDRSSTGTLQLRSMVSPGTTGQDRGVCSAIRAARSDEGVIA